MQVDPIKPVLKVPGTKRLKLKHFKSLSKLAFKFNLRRYAEDQPGRGDPERRHGQGLTLVHFPAQPKPFWSHLPMGPCLRDRGKIMHPMYSSNVLMLSRNMDECKPLVMGFGRSAGSSHTADRSGMPLRLEAAGQRVSLRF